MACGTRQIDVFASYDAYEYDTGTFTGTVTGSNASSEPYLLTFGSAADLAKINIGAKIIQPGAWTTGGGSPTTGNSNYSEFTLIKKISDTIAQIDRPMNDSDSATHGAGAGAGPAMNWSYRNFGFQKDSKHGMEVQLRTAIHNVRKATLLGYFLGEVPMLTDFAPGAVDATDSNFKSLEVPGTLPDKDSNKMVIDDYYVLEVDPFGSNVTSNQLHTSNAFAVLPTFPTQNDFKAIVSQYHADGFTSKSFPKPISNLTKLHLRVSDRRGNTAAIGRMHFWFRIECDQG